MVQALVWSDDQGPQQLWVPVMPGNPQPDTAWADGGPYAAPAAMVAARGTGQTWEQWAGTLASGAVTGPGAGRFTVEELPDGSLWAALSVARRRFLAASFSSS